jgi:hypothetical protein
MKTTMSQYPTCTFVKTNGTVCECPKLKEADFCYYHHRDHLRRLNLQQAREVKCSDYFYKYSEQQRALNPEIIESLDIPSLDDPESIQVALTNLVRAICSNHIEDKKAGLALYGLQLAAMNVGRVRLKQFENRNVTLRDPRPIYPFSKTLGPQPEPPSATESTLDAASTPEDKPANQPTNARSVRAEIIRPNGPGSKSYDEHIRVATALKNDIAAAMARRQKKSTNSSASHSG